jgi:D-alanyl-D-alanine carboxypeptidase
VPASAVPASIGPATSAVVGTSTSTVSLVPATSAVPATVAAGVSTATTVEAGVTVPAPPSSGWPRPAWLGTRPLPRRPDGLGEVQPTPPELVDRRLATVDTLPAPATEEFTSSVTPVPPDVIARSTWREGCPVAVEDLSYIMMSFWGFDERPHTGEMIVHAEAAENVVAAFSRLYAARFPIEEMRVIAAAELEAPPYGDGNNTTAFACRPARGGSSWSQHAFGLAVDINPFHNPYQRGDLVLPELASAYTDRADLRPGMIVAGDIVTTAFADIGWGWGGTWTGLTDPQHFSRNGR